MTRHDRTDGGSERSTGRQPTDDEPATPDGDKGPTPGDGEPATTDMTGVSRRGVLRAGAALSAAPVIASAAGAADAAIGDGPQGIHIAYGIDPASVVTVAFSGAGGDALVHYGPPGDVDTTARASGQPVPGREAMAYTTTLTGLAPGTEYAYRVELNGTTSRQYTFETAPRMLADAGGSFTVTQVGDHGIADPENPGQRASTDDPELVMALAEAQDPDIQLLSGDISYSNGTPSTWELYFETFEGFYAETPFMTVPGNHEAEVGTGLVQYDRRLNEAMPTHDDRVDPTHKRRWYDFVYANTFFMGLNTTADACGDLARTEEFVPLYDPRCETEDGRTYGEVQEAYMREALARAENRDDVKWKIVQFHGPLWTTSPDHEPRRDLQERWGPIFDEYDVDLVLHGDNHVFERTKPLTHTADLLTYSERRRPREEGNAPPPEEVLDSVDLDFSTGTTFVVNGSGGTSHYSVGTREAYIEWMSDEYFGVTRLDIDDESIDVQYVASPDLSTAYDEDGTLPDDFDPENDNVEVVESFSIVKTADGRPTQVEFTSAPATPERTPSLSVDGSRRDDGRVFTGGQTNHVTVTVEAANDPVELRDRIPVEWDVIAGEVEREDGSFRTEPGPDGTQYVYLDADPATGTTVDYFLEAPADPTATGEYTFGPLEARGTDAFADEGWQAVDGTTSTETVIGVSTNLGF